MEYIKLINRFWETNRNTQFTMAETTLYFYLLNEANRNYWQMPIACATAIICASTGMTKAQRTEEERTYRFYGGCSTFSRPNLSYPHI